MTCTNPEISDQILAWVDGALPPQEAERFRVHVASCPSCQAAARDLSDLTKRVSRAYAAQRQTPLASTCPSAEDLIDFASGTTPPRRAAGIERHLAVCGPCRVQVDILAELDVAPAVDTAEAPRLPAALRDAFQGVHPALASRSTVEEAMRSSVPTASVAPRRGGGRGWGLRRVLAAVATFTVIIGVTTLLIVRPDMLGRPVDSDETGRVMPSPRPVLERTLGVGRDPVAAVPTGTGARASSPYGDDAPYQPSPAEAHATPPASGKSAAKITTTTAGSGGVAPTKQSKREGTRPLNGARPAPSVVAAEPESPLAAPPTRKEGRLATAPAPAPNVAEPVKKASVPAPIAAGPAAKASVPAPIVAGPAAKAPMRAPVEAPERSGSAEGPSKSSSHPGGDAASSSARRPESSTTANTSNGLEERPVVTQDAATSPVGREGPSDRYTQRVDEPLVAERAGGASQTPPALAGVPAVDAAPGGAPRNAGSEGQASRPRAQSAPASAAGSRVAVGAPPVQPSLLAHARDVVSRVTGRGGLVVRVTVEPASAAADQVRRIRVEVVLPAACRDSTAEVRRALFRALSLDAARGDEVVVIGE